MIIAGLGCKRGTPGSAILAVIVIALDEAGLEPPALGALATGPGKADELGLRDVAAELGLPLRIVSEADLVAASSRALTRSQRVLELLAVPSLAETAALAAGGPHARLLGPRHALGTATCALATDERS